MTSPPSAAAGRAPRPSARCAASTGSATPDGVAVGVVVADAFCHNMVRALVGALLPVGEGSRPPSWPSQVLTAAVRDPAVRVVAPHGLCLEEVRYPDAGPAGGARRRRPAGSAAYEALPLSARRVAAATIRSLRLMLAVPATRSLLNCLELVVLGRRRRRRPVDELGPGQDQVVALVLRLDDAGALAELARDALAGGQRGDEVVLADHLARVVRLVGRGQVDHADRAHDLAVTR